MTDPSTTLGIEFADEIHKLCEAEGANVAHDTVNLFGQHELTYELGGTTIVIRWPAGDVA